MSLSHRGSAPRMRQGRDAGKDNAAGQKRLPTGDYGQGAALDRAFIGRPAGLRRSPRMAIRLRIMGGPHGIGRAETINTVRARCALIVRAPFHPPRIDESGRADPPRCSFSTQGVGISRSTAHEERDAPPGCGAVSTAHSSQCWSMKSPDDSGGNQGSSVARSVFSNLRSVTGRSATGGPYALAQRRTARRTDRRFWFHG